MHACTGGSSRTSRGTPLTPSLTHSLRLSLTVGPGLLLQTNRLPVLANWHRHLGIEQVSEQQDPTTGASTRRSRADWCAAGWLWVGVCDWWVGLQVLVELKKEMTSQANRRLPQPPEGSTFP